jgi:hypothetical protein
VTSQADTAPKPKAALRIEITLDSGADGLRQRQITDELCQFFAAASNATGQQFDVVVVDPAQLFHEKTHMIIAEALRDNMQYLTPKQQWLHEKMEQGVYQVQPHGVVEAGYLQALRTVLFDIVKQEDSDYLLDNAIHRPDDLNITHMHDLFLDHIASMPRDSKHRKLDSFLKYAEVRADCGELAVAHYLASVGGSTDVAEKQLNIFVSADRGAMLNVEKIADNLQKPTGCICVSLATQFDELATELVGAVKAAYPACKDIPYAEPEVSFADRIAKSRFSGFIAR